MPLEPRRDPDLQQLQPRSFRKSSPPPPSPQLGVSFLLGQMDILSISKEVAPSLQSPTWALGNSPACPKSGSPAVVSAHSLFILACRHSGLITGSMPGQYTCQSRLWPCENWGVEGKSAHRPHCREEGKFPRLAALGHPGHRSQLRKQASVTKLALIGTVCSAPHLHHQGASW